ncbi:MAG: glutamine synthetase [Gammaproteobacteria bacterium]|nr:MAG: glutamine synthetase [Gammaproteobacteria bacterium]
MSKSDTPSAIDVYVVDWHGALRGKRLPVEHQKKILAGETRLPISTLTQDIWSDDQDAITGLGVSSGDPDGLCIPVSDTLLPQAWHPDRLQALCMMHDINGEPSEYDPRAAAVRELARFEAQGLHPVVAMELEFYLLDGSTRETGVPKVPDMLRIAGKQRDMQLYDPRTMDRVEPLFECIYQFAEAMQIPAEAMLAEIGPGQFELNLNHRSNALQAADDAILLRQIIDHAAQRFGLLATFMAKPYTNHDGSGQHVHVSVVDADGNNIFDQNEDRLLHALAGCLDTLEEMQLLLAPNRNSYRRLLPDGFAPNRLDWGYDHRGVALRLPATSGPAARLEHRVAGADANPYLVLAAILAGMRHGLDNARPPANPPLLAGETPTAKRLTHDWLAACDRAEASDVLGELLGEGFRKRFVDIKRHEALRFLREVSPLDWSTYLPRI